MKDKPLGKIKINSASREEIASLYHVGLILAERIIAYRIKHGFFKTAQDLAKVKGINVRLANLLSDNIDWEEPKDKPVKREWGAAFYFLFMQLFNLYYIVTISKSVANNIKNKEWLFIWINVSVLCLIVMGAYTMFCFFLSFLSIDPKRKERLEHTSLWQIAISLIALISLGLGNFIFYQFYSPVGWTELANRPLAVIGLFWGIHLFVTYVPVFIILRYPKLVTNRIWEYLYEFTRMSIGIIMGWVGWELREDLSIIFSLLYGAIGIMYIWQGTKALISQETGYEIFLKQFLDPDSLVRKAIEIVGWQEWINKRLPNPEQQKALQLALNEMYPPSRLKTIRNTIIIGIGSWLIITGLSSVIDWIIQKFLDSLIK